MSAPDFAESAGGELAEWADVMRGLTFPCGSSTCKTATEKCIKCTEAEYLDVIVTYELQKETDRHQCIGKNVKTDSLNKEYHEFRFRGFRTGRYKIKINCVDADPKGNNLDSHRYSNSSALFHSDGEHYHDVYKTDKNGRKYRLQISEENYDIVYGDDGKPMKECEVLPVKLYNQKGCFFCPLFKVLVVAAEDMTRVSFEKLAGAFQTLIVLGLAIWIAVQTLTHVSSLTKQDAPKFLGNILRQSFKFLIAFFLLRQPISD